MQLLDQAGNGRSNEYQHYGGHHWVILAGDFGGGAVRIEAKAPDGTWVPLDGGTLTAPTALTIEAPPGILSAVMDGGTAPSVSMWII